MEFTLELGPEGDERLRGGEPRFELADVPRVVGAVRFEDANFGAKFGEFGVVY